MGMIKQKKDIKTGRCVCVDICVWMSLPPKVLRLNEKLHSSPQHIVNDKSLCLSHSVQDLCREIQ